MPRTLLLLLDNCEHLVEACAQLASALLRTCPNPRLLATSREPLNIDGETVWRIPSLALPEATRTPTLDAVLASEAARLFIERARAVAVGFQATEQNAADIARIVRRLDGIALALELAAARTRMLSVPQIAARLDDRFRLLIGGSRTALPRQQTLQALIDWSYDLLSEPERVLLRRLSVFIGGWTLEAAEAICADTGKREQGDPGKREKGKGKREDAPSFPFSLPSFPLSAVLDLLTQLVDKSLVIVDTEQNPARYKLLETVRQYAAEKILVNKEEVALRRRHRDWYLTLAEEAREQLSGAEQAHWLDMLEREHDNLRHALAFCLEEPGEAETGLRLAGALQRFWGIRGHLFEGRERFATLLSHPDTQARTKTRSDALLGAGALAYFQSDFSTARSLYEESLTLRRELGDKLGIAASLHGLGLLTYDQDDFSMARTLYAESLTLRRELGDRSGIAESLEAFARLAVQGDKPTLAVHLWGAAERLREEIGAPQALHQQEEYHRNVAALRQRLGEEAFSTAWSEGRATSLDQAISQALQETVDGLPRNKVEAARQT